MVMDQRVKSQKIIREIIRERETTSFFSSLFISLITGVCSAAVLGLLLRGGSKGQIKGMKEKATIQFKAGEFIFPREEETNSD
jgi:hypothetical protein